MSTVTGTDHPNLRRSVTRSVVGADELLGLDITDSRGERLGELWDIMLDMLTGRVAYGIVALVRAPLRIYLTLGTAPVYIGWKVGLYARALVGARGTTWVRTTRTTTPTGAASG